MAKREACFDEESHDLIIQGKSKTCDVADSSVIKPGDYNAHQALHALAVDLVALLAELQHHATRAVERPLREELVEALHHREVIVVRQRPGPVHA